MDLNREYAAHLRALMNAGLAANDGDRKAMLSRASSIAGTISDFQHGLGAAIARSGRNAQMIKAPLGTSP